MCLFWISYIILGISEIAVIMSIGKLDESRLFELNKFT